MTDRPSGREESEDERLDRNLGELLQELRVALPGVQVLFAFLLAVPFQQNFTKITSFQEKVYFATLLCTAISAALLISPTAYHRLTFHLQQKKELVFVSNRLSIAGLGFLALAMTGAVMLITDVLFGGVATAVFGVAAAAMFVAALGGPAAAAAPQAVAPRGGPLNIGTPARPRRAGPRARPSRRRTVRPARRPGELREEHFQVELPDEDLDVERDRQVLVDVLAEDLVGLAQDRDVGGLVGGEDRLRVRPGRGDPLAVLLLALLVVGDRRRLRSALRPARRPHRRSGRAASSGSTSACSATSCSRPAASTSSG